MMKLLSADKSINEMYVIKTVEKNEDILERGSYCIKSIEDGKYIRLNTDMYLSTTDCRQVSNVLIDANNLQPVESSFENISKNSNFKLSAVYEKNKVKLTAYNQGQKFSHKVSFNGNIYDNSELLYLLRFVDFSDDNEIRINVLSVETGKIIDLDIKYICNEIVEVNDKSIECIRIGIESKDINSLHQFALYSNDKERKLIRWTFLNQCIEIKL